MQPRIADVTLNVALFPKQARAVMHGRYTLVNRSTQAIDTLHLYWDERLSLDAIDFAGASVQTDYPRFHYRIYKLATPMQPGERRVLGFTTTLEERGFPNSQPLTAIVENGSFVNNSGDQRLRHRLHAPGSLLEDRAKRRKHGLVPELRLAKLEDESARAYNELNHDSDWVLTDITVTTDADQTPIAPGLSSMVSDKTSGDRRTVRFRSDAPINQFFSIQSARYDVRKAVWHAPGHDVDSAVLHAWPRLQRRPHARRCMELLGSRCSASSSRPTSSTVRASSSSRTGISRSRSRTRSRSPRASASSRTRASTRRTR